MHLICPVADYPEFEHQIRKGPVDLHIKARDDKKVALIECLKVTGFN